MFAIRLFVSLFVLCAVTTSALACSPSYQINRGDTLWQIAGDEMGTVWAYPQIHEANLDVIGPDPDMIRTGDTLNIPCLTGALGEIDWSVMPTTAVLAKLMTQMDIQIIDIRSPKKVAAGTIPGAINVPFNDWRGSSENPGAPQSAESYAALLGEHGIRLDVPTIFVHSQSNPMSTGASAYVYWVLKSLGGEQLAILRGGYAAWEADGQEVQTGASTAQPYLLSASFSPEWRASHTDVWAIAKGDVEGVLLDARPHKMFNQVDSIGNAIATTIPTASNLPAIPLMRALAGEFDIRDGVDTVIDHYRSADAYGVDGEIVTFCTSGQLSALNWFYASELATIENVKLYPESLKGWELSVGILGVGEL